MINPIFSTGLIGAIILVLGAAWLEKKVPSHPVKSIKNWLFAIGGLFMFAYAILNYSQGGSIFFIILQCLVAVSSLMMMLNVRDSIDLPILGVSGLGLIIWSLYLFEGYSTIFFIAGLTGIAIGYAMQMGTIKRSLALTIGSILIALFSYFMKDWVFFWLNVFFALFSAFYLWKGVIARKVR